MLKIRFLSQERPFFLYVASMSFFLLYCLVFEILGGKGMAIYLAFVLILATMVVPHVVASFSCQMARAPVPFTAGGEGWGELRFPGRVALPLLWVCDRCSLSSVV